MSAKKIAEHAGMALFTKHMENYKPADPYYEVYIDKKGREKRRRVSREAALNDVYSTYICMLTIPSVISLWFYQLSFGGPSAVYDDFLSSFGNNFHRLLVHTIYNIA